MQISPYHSPGPSLPEICPPSCMSHFQAKNDAPESPRIDAADLVEVNLPTEDQRLSRSPLFQRFAEELAVYRADAPHLTAEKCAQRCRTLSLILMVALRPDLVKKHNRS